MFQKKKMTTKIAFSVLTVFLLAFAALFLAACFSSYSGEEIDPSCGGITITVPRGPGARWSVIVLNSQLAMRTIDSYRNYGYSTTING